jgi:excisionase family DNA binding protein
MPVPRRTQRRHAAPDGYLLSNEAAEILHVSTKTVNRWAREGRLPCVRTLGGHRRFREREIRELLESLKVAPTNPPT